MKILFLSPRQCWPARSGAKLREYHFLRALAQDGEVTYIYFADPDFEPLTREQLPFCHRIIAVPKPGAYTKRQMAQGILGRWPLPILNYTSAAMMAAVQRLTSTQAFDLIHLDSIHMVRYAETATRVVYNWHNIESEAMRRYSDTVDSRSRRWYAAHTAWKLKMLEREILQSAFGHIVCSVRERDQLHQTAPKARIQVVENGVDTAYFAGVADNGEAAASEARNQLVFVGSMDYFPNVEATTSFATGIWPIIRQRLPDATLAIVGANPAPSVQALGSLPGVTVTGTVPDVRPYYRHALAAIVPLRTGGGTRLKILEAMAAGVPVISSPLGAEGLAVTSGKDILLAGADDAEGWVRHLLSLAANPRRQIADAALHLVRSRYDWEILGAQLRSTYQGWLRS